MLKQIITFCVFLLIFSNMNAQSDSVAMIATDTLKADNNFVVTNTEYKTPNQPVYKLKPVADIPLTAITAGWSLYAFSKIYSKEHSSEEKIASLDRNNINAFDRGAVRPFSESLDRVSYYPFFAVMPMPFVFLTGKSTRKDFFKLTFLYLEAMSITGALYTGSVYFGNRYRPYAYTTESSMSQRTRGGAKNSFYAGHVALVATSAFFGAKVYADYHPDSKIKWLFYTLAGTTTAATAYLRYRAGQHFPSDLLVGIVQGTLTGILVPHFHKHKLIKDPNLNLTPYSNGLDHGLVLAYKL
jgi:membrane-associated phospholipid phosphatase